METIRIKVSKDRKYIIPKEIQEKYGFKPNRQILYKALDNKKVIGEVH